MTTILLPAVFLYCTNHVLAYLIKTIFGWFNIHEGAALRWVSRLTFFMGHTAIYSWVYLSAVEAPGQRFFWVTVIVYWIGLSRTMIYHIRFSQRTHIKPSAISFIKGMIMSAIQYAAACIAAIYLSTYVFGTRRFHIMPESVHINSSEFVFFYLLLYFSALFFFRARGHHLCPPFVRLTQRPI